MVISLAFLHSRRATGLLGATDTAARHYEQFTPLNAISVIASAARATTTTATAAAANATYNNGSTKRNYNVPPYVVFGGSDVITGDVPR